MHACAYTIDIVLQYNSAFIIATLSYSLATTVYSCSLHISHHASVT